MSDPSDYVNFSDYLGLNDEAGKQMLERQMVDGDKLRNTAVAAGEHRYRASRAAGEGGDSEAAAYEQSGESVRTGLASYGKFMAAMADPAERRRLMEETYGRGAVTWLDSAIMGSSGAARIEQGGKDFQRTQTGLESRGIQSDARREMYAGRTAARREAESADVQRRQDEEDELNRERLAKGWLGKGFTSGMGGDLHGVKGAGRDARGNMIKGYFQKEAKYQDGYQKKLAEYEKTRPTILGWTPTGKSTNDIQSWEDYYAQNKRVGAK